MIRLASLLRMLAAWISPCEHHVPFERHRPLTCRVCWTVLEAD